MLLRILDRVLPWVSLRIQLKVWENSGDIPVCPALQPTWISRYAKICFGLAQPGIANAVDVGSFGFAILSDIEAFFLINASQGSRRGNVLNAPKVTLFNGQQAIVVDAAFVPFVISVIPVVGEFAAAQQPVIVVLSEGTTDDRPSRRFRRPALCPANHCAVL